MRNGMNSAADREFLVAQNVSSPDAPVVDRQELPPVRLGRLGESEIHAAPREQSRIEFPYRGNPVFSEWLDDDSHRADMPSYRERMSQNEATFSRLDASPSLSAYAKAAAGLKDFAGPDLRLAIL